MNKQDRYKLTEEEKDILCRATRSWQDMIDRMPVTEEDRLKYSSNKVKKERKNGK